MRSLWMLLSGTALVVGLGGLVYYVFPNHVTESITPNIADMPSPAGSNSRVVVMPAANPLLTATRTQFDRWLPSYPLRCGSILFEKINHRPPDSTFCVHEITRRVVASTGVQLTEPQIRDPNVKAHWIEVMKGR